MNDSRILVGDHSKREERLSVIPIVSTAPVWTRLSWARWLVQIGAALFILVLIVAAVFDRSVLVLHILQPLIYVAVLALARKDNAWGLGAGCIMAAFWNFMNIFTTDFIASGLQELSALLLRGEFQFVQIAVPAALGHFFLIIGCLALFFQQRPRLKQWGQFLTGGVLSVAYLVVIVQLTAPHLLSVLRGVLPFI